MCLSVCGLAALVGILRGPHSLTIGGWYQVSVGSNVLLGSSHVYVLPTGGKGEAEGEAGAAADEADDGDDDGDQDKKRKRKEKEKAAAAGAPAKKKAKDFKNVF